VAKVFLDLGMIRIPVLHLFLDIVLTIIIIMNKAQKIIEYYTLTQKLKNQIRTGWQDWRVTGDRLESVAEHVYGVQMLAIAMYSEYCYIFDLKKVILMLAIHELEETMIGDLTMFMISREEKQEKAHKAISKILAPLAIGDELLDLILEFDERKTEEARFAFFCDKLECDLQAKLYDEEQRVILFGQENIATTANGEVRELLRSGKSWSEMWLTFSQNQYQYDENFLEVSNYALNHPIGINKQESSWDPLAKTAKTK